MICEKCGAELGNNDTVCSKCGHQLATGENAASSASAPAMTKEESIALAEKLIDEYGSLEKLQQELNENLSVISKPMPAPKHHAAFKFFWPYMVGAVVTVNVLYFLGYILYISLDTPLLFSLLSAIGVIAMIVILIVGGKTAVKRRNELNIQVDNRNQSERKKYRETQEKTELLKTQYANKKNSLSIYNDIVPLKNRNSRHMIRVKSLLQTNKAETFADALKLITD